MEKSEIENVIKLARDAAWSQEVHDRNFHPDVACLTPHHRLSHYAHHVAKYTPTLIDMDGDIDYRVLADLLIINFATANTLRKHQRKVWEVILNSNNIQKHNFKDKEQIPFDTLRFLSHQSATLAKCCEANDHLEDYNVVGNIGNVVNNIFNFIYRLWTEHLEQPIEELFVLMQRRLLAVEMKHPFYVNIKRTIERTAPEIAKNAYQQLPVYSTDLLKRIANREVDHINRFNNAALEHVLLQPALIDLESKGYIQTELSGLYTVKALGKEALDSVI